MIVQLVDIEIHRVTLANFFGIPLSTFFVALSILVDGSGKDGCGMRGETGLFELDRVYWGLLGVCARVLFRGLHVVGRCRRGSCSETRE
jgi:hypothetical protein